MAVCGAIVGGYDRVRELARAHAGLDFAVAMNRLYIDLLRVESEARTVAREVAAPEVSAGMFGPAGTPPTLLAVGGAYGQAPTAILISPQGQSEAGFLTIGWWTQVEDGPAQWLEAQPVPATLNAAADLAVGALRRHITGLWANQPQGN